MLIAVAIGQFHGLAAGHGGRSLHGTEIHHRKTKNVAIDARQSAQTPAFHHTIQLLINGVAGIQHEMNAAHGFLAHTVLISQRQQPRQLKAGGKTVQNLFRTGE